MCIYRLLYPPTVLYCVRTYYIQASAMSPGVPHLHKATFSMSAAPCEVAMAPCKVAMATARAI